MSFSVSTYLFNIMFGKLKYTKQTHTCGFMFAVSNQPTNNTHYFEKIIKPPNFNPKYTQFYLQYINFFLDTVCIKLTLHLTITCQLLFSSSIEVNTCKMWPDPGYWNALFVSPATQQVQLVYIWVYRSVKPVEQVNWKNTGTQNSKLHMLSRETSGLVMTILKL